MKTINLILFILLFIFPDRQVPKPLFEGIYTETGYGKNEQEQPLNSGVSNSYYVKIYEDKLVTTANKFGTAETIDITYQYKGNDKEGNRIYAYSEMDRYFVDEAYNIMRVLSSPSLMYGANVLVHTYWEVVKGEKYQYYNQQHKEDGSSPEVQYQRYQDPDYYLMFDE